MKDRRRQTTTAGGQVENAGCSGSAGAENRNDLYSGQDPYEFCFAIGGGRFKQTGLNKSNPNSMWACVGVQCVMDKDVWKLLKSNSKPVTDTCPATRVPDCLIRFVCSRLPSFVLVCPQ